VKVGKTGHGGKKSYISPLLIPHNSELPESNLIFFTVIIRQPVGLLHPVCKNLDNFWKPFLSSEEFPDIVSLNS